MFRQGVLGKVACPSGRSCFVFVFTPVRMAFIPANSGLIQYLFIGM